MCFGFGAAADGVGIIAVAAIDQDIARLQQRNQFLNEFIDGAACADHHHGLTRAGEGCNPFGEAVAADQILVFSSAVDERIHLGGGAVEAGHGEAFAFHVEDEVFAHDGEADDADIRLLLHDGFPLLGFVTAARHDLRGPIIRWILWAPTSRARTCAGGKLREP